MGRAAGGGGALVTGGAAGCTADWLQAQADRDDVTLRDLNATVTADVANSVRDRVYATLSSTSSGDRKTPAGW